ncbi:tRNA pseudouridine(55) synthase TruB [Novispirillum itersonii]|uniref:tRNA pseudouridine(55) synthase TruB n=1 Tax=Novispirillum itersonii TaxID=189 RepID=UPI0003776F9E|nr:tRNA pseudouridine(55) synthase TruB [Novispirillum itersonii]
MTRKRRGEAVHGWVAVDKPLGMSSTHVVTLVRRAFNAQKAGHGGTLDPLATGILPVALGEATKTVPYVMDGRKIYRFTVCFGEERSTDDKEGEVTATHPHRPTREELLKAIPQFLGDIQQIPPKYSAVKVDGQRAYDLARDGEEVELKARTILIESFELEEMPDADHAVFRVRTGKGAYVRSLARDLARAVGTVGHVATLRRLACGPFDELSAISLDKLDAVRHSAAPADFLLPVVTALDDIPALALTEGEARRLSNGLPVIYAPVAARLALSDLADGTTVRAMDGERLVAIARLHGPEIRSVRVMNL